MWISSATPAELYNADKRPSLSTPTIAPSLFKRAREQSLPSPEIIRGISYYIHSGNNHKSRSATPPQRSTTTAATFGQQHRWPPARSFRYLTTLTIAVKFQIPTLRFPEILRPIHTALAATALPCPLPCQHAVPTAVPDSALSLGMCICCVPILPTCAHTIRACYIFRPAHTRRNWSGWV